MKIRENAAHPPRNLRHYRLAKGRPRNAAPIVLAKVTIQKGNYDGSDPNPRHESAPPKPRGT